MQLALTVFVAVLVGTILVALIGTLIDKSASGHERHEDRY